MSAVSKLSKLGLKSTVTKVEKRERPEMEVPDVVKLAFTRLIPAQQIAKIAEERIKTENALVSEEMMSVYAETLFSQGSRPTNPRVILPKTEKQPDISGLFQVQERFKIQVDDGEQPLRDRLIYALRRSGLTTDVATRLVDGEINYTPTTILRKPLNELAIGTPTEQSAADKIISLCIGESTLPLTEEEKEAALYQYEVPTVKEGFFDRVRVYVNSAAELKMIFRVVTPVHFVSHGKFADSETPEKRVQLLAAEGQKLIIGTPMPSKK